MNVSGFLIAWLFRNIRVLAIDSEELIANAMKSVADELSLDCVYFFKNLPGTDVSHQRLAKIFTLTFDKTIGFASFSAYQNLMNITKKEQCQKPLRVIFEFGETAENFKEFHWLDVSNSDKINSGTWMIFTKFFHDYFVEKFFQEIFLPFDNEIIIAWIHGEMVHFKEVYQVARYKTLRQHYLGNYSLQTGLLHETHAYHSKANLEGLQLKVAYIEENVPFTTKTRNGLLEGYFGEIWTTLEDILNISSIYVKVDINREGSEDKNSWLGVIQMLKEKKVDVGIGDFIPSNTRIEFLDFSYPLLVSNLQLYYSNPNNEHHFHGYLIPFGNDIWLSLVIWTAINSLFISCFSLIQKHFVQKSRKIISMTSSVFLTFGGLCGQGATCFSRYISGRMLFLYTYVVAMIVIPSYSASLTRHLATKPVEYTIADLNDFYRKGSKKMIVVDGSYEYYLLKSARSERLKEIIEKYGEHEIHPKSYREAIFLICSRKNLAVFAVASALNWELNKPENAHLKEECGLRKMTQDAGMLVYSIIYPKKSRYKKIIDYHLNNLQKNGLIERLQQKYWINGPNLRKKRWKSVNLENSSAVFRIILFGIISSLLILILEQILIRRSRGKTEEKHGHFCVYF